MSRPDLFPACSRNEHEKAHKMRSTADKLDKRLKRLQKCQIFAGNLSVSGLALLQQAVTKG